MPQKLFTDGFFQTMSKSGKLTLGLSLQLLNYFTYISQRKFKMNPPKVAG